MTFWSKYTVFSLSLALFLFPAFSSSGQETQPASGAEEEEIDISADSLSVGDAGTQVEAKGDVEIKRGETVLKADEVRVNRATKEVEAAGGVSVDSPEWKLKADSVHLNMEEETGEILEGDIFFDRDHLSFGGRRLQKFAGQEYHVDEGFFTTCLCESGPPSWKISAEEIDLDADGTGTIRDGVFYILDVPVFYVPYGFFPIRAERQSGFLFPKIGSSNKEGFKFQQPFFWAISKSADATFGIDVETRARVGLLGELRTILSQDAQGQITMSYFNEGMRGNQEKEIEDGTISDPRIPEDRWNVMANHRHTSTSGWMTYSDIFAFSDDLFTRELMERFDMDGAQAATLRKSRYGRSQLGFFKSWQDMHLRSEWGFYQDFIQDDEDTLQKTPQLSFWGRRPVGKTPLEFRWRAEGVSYVRREGADGLRLDLRPELVLPFRVAPYLFGSFSVAPRETLYHLYDDGGMFDRNNSRELVEIGGNVGTSIGRVYSWGGSMIEGVKHVVEPEISYLFIPSRQQNDIPIMDGIDRINRRNLLTFSLTNRFWGKFSGKPAGGAGDPDVELLNPSAVLGDIRELGWFRVALSYDIDRERNGGDTLSDVDMNLRVTPVDYLSFGLDMGLDPGPWNLTQAAAVFSLSDPRPITRRVLDPDFMRPNSINLTYRFLRRGPNSLLAENANINLDVPPVCPNPLDPRCTGFDKNTLGEVGWNIFYHVTDHVLLYFQSNYNTRDSRFNTNEGSVKILSQCECWTLTLTVGRKTNPSKTSFNFEFNLLGLGTQKSLF